MNIAQSARKTPNWFERNVTFSVIAIVILFGIVFYQQDRIIKLQSNLDEMQLETIYVKADIKTNEKQISLHDKWIKDQYAVLQYHGLIPKNN